MATGTPPKDDAAKDASRFRNGVGVFGANGSLQGVYRDEDEAFLNWRQDSVYAQPVRLPKDGE